MIQKPLFLAIIVFVLILSACTSPTNQPLSESPSLSASESNGQIQPTETLLEQQPTESPTLTPQPSPTATQVPLPEIITKDTLSSLQVNRSFRLFTGGLANFYLKRFSPSNNLIAAWGCSYQRGSNGECEAPLLVIFDTETGKVLHTLDPLTSVVKDMAFSPDEKTLGIAGCHTPIYAYGQPDTICDQPRVWLVDIETGENIRELNGYSSPVNSLVFSKDGKSLYTGIDYFKKYGFTDSTIRVWDLENGKKLAEIQPDIENCNDVRLNLTPDGNYLVTQYINGCTAEYKVKWWDLVNPSPRAVGGGYVSPDSSKIALVESYENPVLHIYDIASGKKIKTIPTGLRRSEIPKMAFTPDNNSIVLSKFPIKAGDGLAVVNSTTGELITRLNGKDYNVAPDASYVFSPDGQFLFVYGHDDDYLTAADDNDPHIGAWDTSTWEEIELPQNYRYLTPFDSYYLHFSPDQKSILVNSDTDVAKFGLPVLEQDSAKRFLVEYLQKLADGEYKAASQDLNLGDMSILSGMIANRLPGIDPEDTASVLKALCEDQRFPCLPVKEVIYASQIDPNIFDFVVSYKNPDGSNAIWPECDGLSPEDHCSFREGFEFAVKMLDDGTFTIYETLPYSMWLE